MKTFLLILGFLITIAGALLADLTNLYITAFTVGFFGINLTIAVAIFKVNSR